MFRLRLLGRCVNVTHDRLSPSHPTAKGSEASKSITSLDYNSTTFKSYETSFAGFILVSKKMYSPLFPTVDQAQEHMYFLLYWLNKHVFPNKSKRMKLEWIPLVEALHSFDDVATGPSILAHLYHILYQITRGPTLASMVILRILSSKLRVSWGSSSCPNFGKGPYYQSFNLYLPLFFQDLQDQDRSWVWCLSAQELPLVLR